jgi:hypothetical protein
MSMPATPLHPDQAEAEVFAAIAARAGKADAGEISLADDLSDLARAGLLAEIVASCLPGGDALRGVTLLRRLGRASLSVGRLVEGHVNAHRLIALYAPPAVASAMRRDTATFLGVWGADGTPPVRLIRELKEDVLLLSGRKRFCSGLGLVQRAVVLAAAGVAGPQMVLADVSDPARAEPEDWQVSGMRATQSGGYDFDDVAAQRIGAPGDVLAEPHFEGGIWRYLALKTGAIEALAEAVRMQLRKQEDAGGSRHRARLVRAASAAQSARLSTEAAARAVEAPGAGPAAVSQVLAAREVVEASARSALEIADRVLGTAGFRSGSRVDLIRRDLAFYLRQADLDGKSDRAATAILAAQAPVGEQW